MIANLFSKLIYPRTVQVIATPQKLKARTFWKSEFNIISLTCYVSYGKNKTGVTILNIFVDYCFAVVIFHKLSK